MITDITVQFQTFAYTVNIGPREIRENMEDSIVEGRRYE